MPSSGRIRLSLIVPLICCICVCSCDDESGGFAPEPIILPQVHRFPQWSVGGDSLYYIDHGVTELLADGGWLTDPDSAGLRIIPVPGGKARSPDGREIACVAYTDCPRTNGTIWVVKADGSHNVQMTRSRLK
jgi:hypothetical protein